MFTNIRLKNFKAWGDQLWDKGVDLAPITLFLGVNSVGKTSLLQPLRLLQQTYFAPDRSLDLDFGGNRNEQLDIGAYDQVVHAHLTNSEMAFGFDLDRVERFISRTRFAEGETAPEGVSSQDWVDDHTDAGSLFAPLNYRVTYGMTSGSFHLKKLELGHSTLDIAFIRDRAGAYRVESKGLSENKSHIIEQPKKTHRPINSLRLPESIRGSSIFQEEGVEDLVTEVMDVFDSLQYLGPLRDAPRFDYSWDGQEPSIIGARGEYTIHRLLSDKFIQSRKHGESIAEEVSGWLKRMGVADSVRLQQRGRSRSFEVIVQTGPQSANLVNVGFGVSQVLPMIVLALTAPEGSTIIAEQPEIHLHPSAQSELANLMIHTAKARKLQFLVETHSEHLFRRMQTLIADPESDASHKDCAMHFVSRGPNGEAELTRLLLDEFGRIRNWPERFFGDSIGETEKQMRAMLSRLKSEKPS